MCEPVCEPVCEPMSQDLEDEVSDVARANKMQREKKRKHGIRTTMSSGSKKSTTATNVSVGLVC